jgi:ribonuclease D
MEYAASDVRYLVRLSYELRQRLAAVSRLEWVLEECSRLEQVRYSPPDFQKDAFLRIKGSDQLNPGELAVLKELVDFREAEARILDWPPFRVLSNETLLFLAQRSDTPLRRVPGLSSFLMAQAGERLQAAIDRGRSGPGLYRPRMPKRDNPWTPGAQVVLRRLKQWRTERGAMLGLDPALLWPAASLERLALQPNQWETELTSHIPPLARGDAGGLWQRGYPQGSPRGDGVAEPSPRGDTGEITDVREWQRREFSEELKQVLDERLC